MMFKEFLRAGKVKKSRPDMSLAKSLLRMSRSTLAFTSSCTIDEQNASTLLSAAYEGIRQICEAICAINGYKVYSHEAYTSYLQEILGEQALAHKFDRLRKLRNGINYYGEVIDVAQAKQSLQDILTMVDVLTNKYLSSLSD